MTQPTTPLEVFELIRQRGEDMLRTSFMESGRSWDDEVYEGLLKPVLGIGVASAAEHFAQHPEHLALAGKAICTHCREPVQSWQVGTLYNQGLPEEGEVCKVAWPCGHYQTSS